MKTTVLCLIAILIFAASCKKGTTATSDRDKFVGTYSMHDTVQHYTYDVNTHVAVYDTEYTAYTLRIVALPNTTDKIVISNTAGCGACLDTAAVMSNIASVISASPNVLTATLVGNVITLEGGASYNDGAPGFGGLNGHGVGTKQ